MPRSLWRNLFPQTPAVPVTAGQLQRPRQTSICQTVKAGRLGQIPAWAASWRRLSRGIVRPNRDTLYFRGVSIDAGPVTVTLPDAAKVSW